MKLSYRGVMVGAGALMTCVVPLYAELSRGYFGQRIVGTLFGAATMAPGMGIAFGPFAGGWLFDHFSSFGWLYPGSFAVAMGAVAVALAFPRRKNDAWRSV